MLSAAEREWKHVLPETFRTVRLILRPIAADDAGAIFDSYAQDTTVTRFVIWRPHRTRSDTEAYVAQCIATPLRSPEPMSLSTGKTASCGVDLLYVRQPRTVSILVTF